MSASKEIVLSEEGKEPKFFPVNNNPFRVGKSPANDLPLDGKAIPAHQCEIVGTETGYRLRDLSGKGTIVDGKKVKETELTDETVVKIGKYHFYMRDIPAHALGTVTAVYGSTDQGVPTGTGKTVLSLIGKTRSGRMIKAVLDGMTMSIGSAPGNVLVIDDDFVSRFHSRCYQKDGVWFAEDLESTNGTFVNDEKITVEEIHPGMILRVGKTNMHVLAGKKDLDFPIHCGIISADPGMKDVFDKVVVASNSGEPVLLIGETGSGKEVVARAINRMSKWATKQFLKKDCSLLPKNLIESELFGHKKGAFTGADDDKIGIFEAADGGTLFLDEIGEIPLDLQPKFLQAVEDKVITRIGETMVRKVDTRIISATNRSLETMVEEGTFREDLYFRISVFNIHIPPLRKRPKDIPVLAQYFLETFTRDPNKKLSRSAMNKLQEYNYPGNVRDLKNTITRAALMCRANTIGPSHIEFTPVTLADRKAEAKTCMKGALWKDLERKLLVEQLEAHSWNQAATARDLGLDGNKIARMMKRLGIETARSRK